MARVGVVVLVVLAAFTFSIALGRVTPNEHPPGLPPPLEVGPEPVGAAKLTHVFSPISGLLHLFTIADGKFAVKEQVAGGVERFAPWKELAGKLRNTNPFVPGKVAMTGAATTTRDGRIMLFVVGPAGHLEVRWETRIGEEQCRWSKWHGIPGKMESSPKVVSSDAFGPEVFTVGSKGQVARTWLASTGDERDWILWKPMEGPVVRPESLFVMQHGSETHLFAVEAEPTSRILHAFRKSLNPRDPWSLWEVIEGPSPVVQAPFAVSSPFAGSLQVFALGSDGVLYQTEKQLWDVSTPAAAGPVFKKAAPAHVGAFPALRSFANVGVKFKFAPTAEQNLDGRITVVATDESGAVWIRYQVRNVVTNHNAPVSSINNPNHLKWSEWHSLGGTFQSQPRLVRRLEGRLQIFAIGHGPHAPLYESLQVDIDSLFPPWALALGKKGQASAQMISSSRPPNSNSKENDLTVLKIGGKSVSQLLGSAEKIEKN